VTANGRDHAWQRKMLTPAFSYANLKGMVPFMKTAADDLVQLWKGNLEESQKDYADVMVLEDLSRLALDVIGESAFGYQFKSVLGGETEITKAFSHLTTGVQIGALSMALPFYNYLPTNENRRKWNATKITNEVVMKVRSSSSKVQFYHMIDVIEPRIFYEILSPDDFIFKKGRVNGN